MSSYRDDARKVEKDARWTFGKFLPLALLVIIVLAAVGFGLRSMGMLGGTIVERKVFEHSYQRSESIKSQIAVDEASLAEIERKLMNPNLDSDTRYNLEAQAAAARIRINAARARQ